MARTLYLKVDADVIDLVQVSLNYVNKITNVTECEELAEVLYNVMHLPHVHNNFLE